MVVRQRSGAVSCLLAVLVAAGVACEGGEDDGHLSSHDGAVVAGDASIPGADTGVVVGGGTTGGPGAVTGGGTQGGAVSGATTGGTGGTQGGGVPGARMDAGGGALGGASDAGRDAGAVVVDAGRSDAASTPVGDAGAGDYEAVRQVCLDTINMYRATRNLPALTRAPAAAEACADEGAKYDGDLNRGRPFNMIEGHASTRNRSAACKTVGFGAQNACPNWGVGPRTGNATLADATKKCLAQMWAEGEPPIPIADCVKDQAPGGCFLTHGHWINMVSTTSSWVACGFYNVEGGTYWLNQDFNYARR